MRYPRISVVTPSFKAAAFIEDTLRSVLDQAYPELEYLVVDGAGDSETPRIIGRYEKRLAYWCSERDAGQYDALNKGFARATGEILCWLNAGDMLMPRALFAVAEIFEACPGTHWISSLQPGVWDADGYLVTLNRTPGFSRAAFLDGLYLPGTLERGYWIQQESTFWRRGLWQRVGARIPVSEAALAGDFALWAQFYRHEEMHGVEYPLGGFRVVKGQRSEDVAAYATEATRALEALRRDCGWRAGRPARDYEHSVVQRGPIGQVGATWTVQKGRFTP